MSGFPDAVLAEADEIVNVDLAPEDLQQRLREGKDLSPGSDLHRLGEFFQEFQSQPAAGIDSAGTGGPN